MDYDTGRSPCGDGLATKERFNVKPKAVLAYCREKGIKAVDIRFPDALGRWRHFSIPASSLTESVFETGLGQESCFFYDSIDDQTPWILVPVQDSHYLDPLQSEPTLVLMATLQDAWSGEECWFDPRSIAVRCVEAFRGSGVADEVLYASTVPFRLHHPASSAQPSDPLDLQSPAPNHALAGGRFDPDAWFRANLMHLALESGLTIERHYRGSQASSEFLIGAKPLVQACDDHLLLRSLIETTAMQQGLAMDQTDLVSKSAWTFLKGSEALLGGSRGFGLSEVGWYAAGGVLKHANALAAIGASSPMVSRLPPRSWKLALSDRMHDSLVAVDPVSNDPRYRSLAYRSMPALSCPYLTMSAVAMAMLDGILRKLAPPTEVKSSSESAAGKSKSQLAEQLAEDTSFLMHGEVFSERLIAVLCKQLVHSTV